MIHNAIARFSSTLLTVLLAVLGGCADTAPPRAPGPDDLDAWVDQTLAPYLAEELGRHPRFKGQPVLLVGMEGDDVQARIDLLTNDLRARLMARLAEAPGVQLAWRPSTRPWRHPRRLADVRCGNDREARYYIGIDIAPAANGTTRVLVRALDIRAGAWMPGFGKSWSGRLTPAQAALEKQRRADEYLRGLRPLPFDADQPDRVAAYLAHNLSCLLRQRGDEDLRLTRAPLPAAPAFFRATMELVANYLSRFREVRVVDDPAAANAVLQGELHPLGKDLYQLWVVTRFKQDEARLAGADTEAYVYAPPSGTPVAANTSPATPHRRTPEPEPQPRQAGLVSLFTAVAPLDQVFCTTSTPWIMGDRVIGRNATLPLHGCFALKLVAGRDAWLSLLHRDSSGRLFRLIPSGCPGGGQTRVEAGQTIRFPDFASADGPVIDLIDQPGEERFYALLTRDSRQQQRLQGLLADLPPACEGRGGADASSWMARIERLMDAGGGIDLRRVSVRQRR